MAHLGPVLVVFVFAAVASFSSGQDDGCSCKLETTSDTSGRFNDTLTTRTRFIYLKLNFLDIDFNTTEFAYLRDTLDVVDPLTRVLSIGSNGQLLLQSPFDFKYMSLGTLSNSGVGSIDVDIIAPDCFTDDIPDEDKLCSIIDLLYGLIFDAIGYYESTTGNMLLSPSSFNLCLERQSAVRRYVFFGNKEYRTVNLLQRLSESGHGILQSTVEYHCWTNNATTNEMDILNPVIFQRDRAILWVRVLLDIVATLIVLFSPYLFFKYFDWQNPPKDNMIRIDTRPYPFGFFHFVFYSTYKECDLVSLTCWVRYIFFFFFMTFLCCIQFLPFLYVDRFNYNLRKSAAERLNVWTFDGGNIALTCYSIAVIFLNIAVYNYLKIYVLRRQKNTANADFKRIGRSYLTAEWLFPQEEDKDIIAEICPEKGGDIFIDNPRWWSLCKVWRKIRQNRRCCCVKFVLRVITLVYWIGQLIPLIYYTNIVMAIGIALVTKKLSKNNNGRLIGEHGMDSVADGNGTVEEIQGQRQTLWDVVKICLIFGFPFAIVFFFVTSMVFFQMFIACSFLIEVVFYTLIGLIVNAKYVVSWIAFAIGVVIFLVQTVTGYSNSYVTLFYEIFDVCESKGSRFVTRDVDGVPQIKLRFFEAVAYKIKPWGPALFFIYVQLVSAAVFFLLGFLLLYYVDGLNNLNDLRGQSELFGAAVIGGILPIAKLLTAPQALVKCREKAKRCKLETLIREISASWDEKDDNGGDGQVGNGDGGQRRLQDGPVDLKVIAQADI